MQTQPHRSTASRWMKAQHEVSLTSDTAYQGGEEMTRCLSKQRRLDIVLVHCKHSVDQIRSSLQELLSLDSIASRKPCLHIYTKSCYNGSTSVLESTFPEAAKIVKQVNLGREGTAYLEYILTNYYNLPEHVLFLHDDMEKHFHLMLPRFRHLFRYVNISCWV